VEVAFHMRFQYLRVGCARPDIVHGGGGTVPVTGDVVGMVEGRVNPLVTRKCDTPHVSEDLGGGGNHRSISGYDHLRRRNGCKVIKCRLHGEGVHVVGQRGCGVSIES